MSKASQKEKEPAYRQAGTKRPPVVSVMGHIDHGKSTLLDYIRKTKVAETEAGGITQKMSAYKIVRDTGGEKQSITFLDTPGHEAFKELRSRGAQVADIAILVVAADEGVKPQTIEAIKAIKSANLPLIVAINKIDKPNANADRVKNGLLEHEVFVEGYGGDTPVVEVSAVTGQGVDELLDMIVLLSDILDLKMNSEINAEGIVIEAQNDKNKGISATLIIKDGTMKNGQFIVCESSLAPIRMMEDFQGKKIVEAGASDPVKVIGFSSVPPVGSIFQTLNIKKDAEALVEASRLGNTRSKDSLVIGGEGEGAITIPVVIKASTTDVIEAIIHEIQKIKSERVGIKVISTGVGYISEGDIKGALGNPETIVLGFEVKTDASAKILAERSGVKVESFNIIYKLTEWLQEYMKQKTPKMMTEEITGRAKILKLFSKTKDKQVIGARVEEGYIKKDSDVRIMRRDALIATGKIRELQQSRSKANEVAEGLEFGAMIECKMDLAPGDKIECFLTVEK